MKKALFFIFIFWTGAGFSEALQISDFYKGAEVGQWILMRSSDGLLTKTSVIAKGDKKLTLKIENFKKKELISRSEQVIDVEAGRVISIKIYDQDSLKEITPDSTEMDDFLKITFTKVGEKEIAISKGLFRCDAYKGIYEDRIVRVWLNQEVPILHLVKIRMTGISVELVDYGSG